MYYSYVEIEYVATSFSPARTDLALKLLKTKITSLSLQIIIFLRPMISATKILSPQPRTTPSEEAPGGGVSRFA